MPEPVPSIVPEVEIVLDDRPRRLRLDFRAIAAAERATGKNLLRPGAVAAAGANELTAILWGGLLHEDPDVILDDVRSWIHYGNASDVFIAVMDAVAKCFPEAEGPDAIGDDGTAAPPAMASLGRTSGRSRASSSKSRRKSSGD